MTHVGRVVRVVVCQSNNRHWCVFQCHYKHLSRSLTANNGIRTKATFTSHAEATAAAIVQAAFLGVDAYDANLRETIYTAEKPP